MAFNRLDRSFYTHPDVVFVAKNLLGKVLCTKINNQTKKAIILETEAYRGSDDRACHAYQKRTKRVEVMYGEGGFAYVYLCYGMHHLFNVVTNLSGKADACLIRAIQPLEENPIYGPGRTTSFLSITKNFNGLDLLSNTLWIEDQNITPQDIQASKRIGIDYAGEDKHRLWNFSCRPFPFPLS